MDILVDSFLKLYWDLAKNLSPVSRANACSLSVTFMFHRKLVDATLLAVYRTFTARAALPTSVATCCCFLAVLQITWVHNSQAPGFPQLTSVIGVKYASNLDTV